MSTTIRTNESKSSRTNGWHANASESGSVRTVRRHGREYLRFPLVPLREMVIDYPENGTREYLPARSIRRTADAWAGTPITFIHPENAKGTARSSDAYTGTVIGTFQEPEAVGSKLRGNGLIDVEKARSIGGLAWELVERLRAGETLSVSAGYATVDDVYEPGRWNGEEYDLVQGPPLPDHVAIFPSDEFLARCTPEDGCAAPRLNAHGTGRATDCGCGCGHEEDTMNESTNQTRVPKSEFEELKIMLEELTSTEGSGVSAPSDVSRRNYGSQTEEVPDYPLGTRSAWEARSQKRNAKESQTNQKPERAEVGDVHRDAIATRTNYEARTADRPTPSERMARPSNERERRLVIAKARRLKAAGNHNLAAKALEEAGIEGVLL